MLERGRVHSVDKRGFATVRFDRQESCEKCRMCAPTKDGMKVEVRVENTLSATAGDVVSVQMADRAVLVSATVVYLIPLFTMAVALVLTKSLSWWLSLIITMGGVLLSFYIIAIIDRAVRKKKGYMPQMTEIIKQEVATEASTDTVNKPKEE